METDESLVQEGEKREAIRAEDVQKEVICQEEIDYFQRKLSKAKTEERKQEIEEEQEDLKKLNETLPSKQKEIQEQLENTLDLLRDFFP